MLVKVHGISHRIVMRLTGWRKREDFHKGRRHGGKDKRQSAKLASVCFYGLLRLAVRLRMCHRWVRSGHGRFHQAGGAEKSDGSVAEKKRGQAS